MLPYRVGKPAVLTAFGLVTEDNAPFFVPFNSTIAPFNGTVPADGNVTVSRLSKRASAGVSDSEQDDAYTAWITAAANAGVSGAMQYQVRTFTVYSLSLSGVLSSFLLLTSKSGET